MKPHKTSWVPPATKVFRCEFCNLPNSLLIKGPKFLLPTFACCLLSALTALAGCASAPQAEQQNLEIRQHSDRLFEKLHQEQRLTPQAEQTSQDQPTAEVPVQKDALSSSSYLIARGLGDLSKGRLICQQVSETIARLELAKQIRVTVKQHSTDRVREASGRPFEQDIEIVREELVDELLRDVKVLGHSIDEAAGTCSTTVIMPILRLPGRQAQPDAIPK